MVQFNPATQYATDANLRARQRLWQFQDPAFDIVGWVLDEVAGLTTPEVGGGRAPGTTVLDVGCGNGLYLAGLAERAISGIGCDLSLGMLRAAGERHTRVNADVVALPFPASAFDLVLAPHMLYHVADRRAAARELRRVTRPGSACVVVTNGAEHMGSLRELVERAVGQADPGWTLDSPATSVFSLENGAEQLGGAFADVELIRAESPPSRVPDADIVAAYVESIGDHYQHSVSRPWAEVVDAVRADARRAIARDGAFVVQGVVGAFLCQ